MRIAGLTLSPPNGFDADEALVSFRAPAPDLADPRARQKQTALRPSWIVHRRRVGAPGAATDAATLEMLAGEVAAELMSSIVGVTAMTTEPFTFRDGAQGIIIGFDFPAPELATARQYHALRLDEAPRGAVLTTQTLTVDALKLVDTHKRELLDQLASLTLADGGELA